MKKLLALLCVVALLGALCVPTLAAENTVPVAAEVPSDWTAAYLYAWGDSGEIAAWPGVPMAFVDGWFCAYMPDNMANVIISNGSGVQTADLAVEPGMPVCVMASNIGAVEVEMELPIEVPAADELEVSAPPVAGGATVHAHVPEDWADCTLYAWGDNGDNGGWPGVAMTKGDDGLWTAELGPNYKNIIIASSAGTIQTVDLSYAGGECWVAVQEAGADGKFAAAVVYEEPADWDNVESAPAPVGNTWYVAGDFNNWNAADEAYKMADNGDGTFSLTFDITAGGHALKVTNGTWDVNFGGEGADGNLEFNCIDGELTVTFDGAAITLSGAEAEVGTAATDPAAPADPVPVTGPLYVAGDFNGWTNPDEAYKMTDNGDGTFSLVLELTAGTQALKVTNGTWDLSWGGDGENGNYVYEMAADGKVTVTFDGATVTVTEGEVAPETTEPATDDTTAPAEDDTTAPSEDTTDNKTEEPEESGNGTLIGIIVAVVAVLAGGVAIFFIMKKKN